MHTIFRDKDGAVIDLFDMRVEIFLDEDGYPTVHIKTDTHLSEDFVSIRVDGKLVHAGIYHEDIEKTSRKRYDED